jgi:hypothetical protein
MTAIEKREVAQRLHNFGFIRLRNGIPTPQYEDMELIVYAIDCVEKSIDDESESGLLLKILGMK